jgi:hypothetical protein
MKRMLSVAVAVRIVYQVADGEPQLKKSGRSM